jgi:hypothetical protein
VSRPLLASAGAKSSSSSRLLTVKRLEFSDAVKPTSSDTGGDVDVDEVQDVCRPPDAAVTSIRP